MFIKKKHVVWVILLTFLFSLFPTNTIKASANDDINIISSTNITVQTAKKWAESKGATETFVSIADLYWKYAGSHGNVNPAVAYVQAAKETGYGKFGGVIDANYHNPCGLKTSTGGADDDPNAHMRFNNWDEGVQAHLDHLALYAGASGYPRTGNTYDPRHFGSIAGRAKTVTSLGGNWAPSSTYGSDILALYRNLEILEPNGKMIGCIDEPSGAEVRTDSLLVRGWALNTSGISQIKIYIDNALKATITTGQSRPDVKNAYPTYIGAETSGYSTTIDISDLSNGTKTLKVEQIGKDNSVNTLTKTITLNRVLSRMYIDTPVYNSTVNPSTLKVSGWAVNKANIKAINIYVNGALKGTTTTGISRPDVQKVYPEFANASTSGFSKDIDMSSAAGGKNTIKVEQVTTSGSTYSIETVVNVNKPKPRTYIDAPVAGTTVRGNSLTVAGWSVNNDGIKAINIYVDGVLKGTTTVGISRPDVKNVYPEYTNASTSGFSKAIDISGVSSGTRVVKVEQVSNTGTTSEEVKINVVKPQPVTCIDTPSPGSLVNNDTLTVSGWAINNSIIKSINVYVDGVLKGTTTVGISRPDVQKVYPNYLNSDKSGFSTKINISSLAAGNRVVKVEQVASDGSKHSLETTVKINKLQAITCIDNPASGTRINSDSLLVTGWAINNTSVEAINFYVDGVLKGTTTTLSARADVQKVYPQYAYAGMSGYSKSIDITDVAEGNRILKVEQVASDGNKYSTQVTFTKDPQARTYIDTPVNGASISGKSVTVKGWSLNNKGVSAINIYVDGVLKGTTKTGLSRPDVKNVYPEYTNAATSGFSTNIDVSDVALGQRTIKVEQVAGNGQKTSVETKVNVVGLEARMDLDTPANDSTITDKTLTVKGWALNPSGVKEVVVYVDGVKKASTTANLSRPDVKNVYPEYNNAENSGYSTSIDLNTIAAGKRTIKVVSIGNDGKEKSMTSTINIVKKVPLSIIDEPTVDYIEGSDTLKVSGWTLNDSGIKNINISIDGIRISTIGATISRADVISAFPGYQSSLVCGYTTSLNLSGYTKGHHNLAVETIGNDGSMNVVSRTFYYKMKDSKLIVVDPGHNNGGDEGAEATVNGVRYLERELNDAIALKTKTALENQGYTVIFTRMPFATEFYPTSESLARRVQLAESLKANAFVSIHQNKYDVESANGTEVYYSTNNTDWGYAGPSDKTNKVNVSKQMAATVCNNICGVEGFRNRGAKDGNLFVCRNTSMPSILVECGFISNAADVAKLSSPSGQENIARAIANGVKSVIG